jgi:predicted PurR-regulated permease PerM
MQKPVENQHTFETNKKYYTISIYTVIVVLICALIVKLIFSWAATSSFIRKYLVAAAPVIAGFFVAYLLNPLVNFLDRRLFSMLLKKKFPKISRALSILGAYLIVLGTLVLIIVYLIPQLTSSLTDLVGQVQNWYNQSIKWFNSLQEKYPDIDITTIVNNLQTSIMEFLNMDRITGLISNMVPKLFSTSVAVFKVIYNLIFAFIVSIYVLLDKNRLVRNLKRLTKALFPKDKASSLIETGGLTHHIFSRFIVGKTVDSLIIGVLCFIVMSVFQMPFALIISLIVGITNMVPYVGPFIGAVPGFFIIFISSPIQSLFYLILILAIQQFDGLYLGPKILGDSTGLRPIWIIFAISVGGAAGGVLGMFLGVPFVAVIARLLDDWVEKRIQMRSQDE